jgi:autotransporter strand-loop-strand O-heptosyltransferase
MSKPKIYAHGSYVGDTGYNQHTRDFFRHLDKHADIKVRNFTVGKSWNGYNENAHDNEHYFNSTDKKLLYKQILWNTDKTRSDYPLYPHKSKEFTPDLNIVLCETNHHLFYDNYNGPKIAYNVWESTLQPQHYFNKLKEFDEMWVPSKWQRDCTIAQGYDPNKIKVVPEGVDVNTFYPDDKVSHPLTKDKFTFFLAGRWDYRKSIKEVIETFVKTFNNNEPVELIISVDNPFSNDGLNSTEERLKHYGLEDDRIKILHFPPREEYIRLLKSCSVFVSCARAEGWNLPLIEAMACGTPSIYSDCSGQLEFAEGRGIPVRISHELPVSASTYNHFNDNVGNYYEPDFNDLGEKMMAVYGDYKKYKTFALVESEQIREEFSWERIAEIGLETINDFLERKPWIVEKTFKKNEIIISYLDGPKVEVLGDEPKEYYVEFINKDTDKVVHSQTIKNNMWVVCGRKYYIPWIIKINGEVYNELNLEGKTVMISLESKALGDTISWAPYAVEFQKKYNCKVLLSTFKNTFFEGLDSYKNITFINPGESHVCDAIYRIGWFKKDNKWEDKDKNPNQPNLIPLQQAATDILGLEYKEIHYGLNFEKRERPIEKEYVVFGPNATSGCKEWDYNNWVGLSKLIKELGYEVITLTQKPFHIDGVTNIWEEPLDVVANYLYHAKAFVGLGSGLSWFNWGLGNYTFMVNGFARPDHEFTTNITKIYNDNTCIFCWNDEVFVFDPGDWDWCPVYKGTKKQHVCQRSITPLQVFQQLITKI